MRRDPCRPPALPASTANRIDWPEMRICNAGQIVVGVERAGQFALRHGMVGAVLHVLFARPDQLDRRARHLLGDQTPPAAHSRSCRAGQSRRRGSACGLRICRRAGRKHPARRRTRLRHSAFRSRPRISPACRAPWRSSAPCGVVLVGIAVDRLDLLGGARDGGFGVAILVADKSRLRIVETFGEPFGDRIRWRLWRSRLRPRRSAAHRARSWRATRYRRRRRRSVS